MSENGERPMESKNSFSRAGTLQNLSGGFDALRQAGQSLLNSGAELADKSRQFVGSTFGVVTLDAKNAKVASNTVVEVAVPAVMAVGRPVSCRPPMSCFFNKKSQQLVLIMDLPGLEKNNVEILVEGDIMSISGYMKDNQTACDIENAHDMVDLISERHVGQFQRCFKLPSNASQEDIEAVVENGRMDIRIKCSPGNSTPPTGDATIPEENK